MGTNEPDRALLEAARKGDVEAIERLLARYEKTVYRFGLRLCASEEDAREVLQQTLLAAFQHLPSFRGEAHLSSWLFQIARSYCSRERRPKAGQPAQHQSLDATEVRELADEAPTPDLAAHAVEVGEAIGEALQALPEPLRDAVLLRDVEGHSNEEAAELAGTSTRAFKSRLHRGRLALRASLAAVFGELVDAEASEP